MKILLKVPLRHWNTLRQKVCSTWFAADEPWLIGKPEHGGYKWATFESPYLSDIIKVCQMLPEGSECWEIEAESDDKVYISTVTLVPA